MNNLILGLILLAIVALLYVLSLIPREIEMTDEMIRIRLWIGKEEIPYSEIANVEVLDYSGSNFRLCGISGVKSRIGWFWNSRIGVYKAFITNRQDSILVTLRSGKKRAFSVDYETKNIFCPQGTISYWINDLSEERKTLVFLPGLTADHRLFDKQVEYFEPRYNVMVWDAPGHGASRPFTLSFSLEDKARWLHEILCTEGIEHPVLVGQSMGGYVAQMYMQLYPHSVEAFVSIDSAPLQRQYLSGFEIWCLKHVEKMYRWYPWEPLKSAAARGCAVSEYGRQLMLTMLSDYTHSEYALLAAHGYRILAEAIEQNLPYEVDCPALLICGERDMAGSAKRYNTEWTKRTGIPLIWVPNAGHNSNTDQPQLINTLIEKLLRSLE